MRAVFIVLAGLCLAISAPAQTAEELVAKNIQAKGGLEKIKAVKTVAMTGKVYIVNFGVNAEIAIERKRQDMIRQNVSVQGMTQVHSYDGKEAWQIDPFEGRKDPELMGEDTARALVDDADIDGPLVDYQAKGNKVEYLGHDTVDGDDAYKLKVTLKNGDIIYYYLDPDTCIEIRREIQQFIRGAVRETTEDMGSYKQVEGVYYPTSIEAKSKDGQMGEVRLNFDKVEVNAPLENSYFAMPVKK